MTDLTALLTRVEAATLFSAAPDLLKALAAWGLEKSEPGHDLMGIEQEMRAALSKATGEQ